MGSRIVFDQRACVLICELLVRRAFGLELDTCLDLVVGCPLVHAKGLFRFRETKIFPPKWATGNFAKFGRLALGFDFKIFSLSGSSNHTTDFAFIAFAPFFGAPAFLPFFQQRAFSSHKPRPSCPSSSHKPRPSCPSRHHRHRHQHRRHRPRQQS